MNSFGIHSSLPSPTTAEPEACPATAAAAVGDTAAGGAPITYEAALKPEDGRQLGEQRRHPRLGVEGDAPMALRRHGEHEAVIKADILDIHHEGLCLLLAAEEAYPGAGESVTLLLNDQPGFARSELPARVRWAAHSGWLTTIGLMFEHPLELIPPIVVDGVTCTVECWPEGSGGA